MKKVSPYSHLTIDERFKRVMEDESFRAFCKYKRSQGYFDRMLPIVEKISKIDVSSIKYDNSLINGVHLFTPNQIIEDVMEFCAMIDRFDPNGISLLDRFHENKQYLTFNSKGEGGRSYCKSKIEDNGDKTREIHVELEGRISDTQNAIHEFGHSFAEVFMNFKRQEDYRMSEIPTTIMYYLSSQFMRSKYSQYRENFVENDIYNQFSSVQKARECLMEAMIVKAVCGEETLDSAMKSYGDLFKEFPNMLQSRLEKIETFKFIPMYESQYIVPQAIALEMRERYKTDPQQVAKQLKYLIENNHCITEEQALQYLGLPERDQLIDEYVTQFPIRTLAMVAEKKQIQQEKNADVMAP